ncbi:MAG TPA: 5-deoxy-glucuronate isomerase [Streptosporangiaceae bacterium]|nr:5-deoxy-glucuronate isomerase [Streptosporangiaceae bacterium]
MDIKLHHARGSLAHGLYELALTPEDAGWAYSGLRVLELGAGQAQELSTGGDEMLVLPLAGGCVVECDGQRFELAGQRPDARLPMAPAQGGRAS